MARRPRTLHSDANQEYIDFFSDPPDGWSAEQVGLIQTRREHLRPAWHLSDGQTELVAVEHETGLEVLVIPVATGLAVEAITNLIGWGWKRWKERRAGVPDKQDAALVIEVPRVGSVNTPPIRLIVPPPVSAADIARYLQLAAGPGQGA